MGPDPGRIGGTPKRSQGVRRRIQDSGGPSGKGTKGYAQIPRVTLPEDSFERLGPFLAECYERHGPVFRSPPHNPRDPAFGGREIVYLVGPEANRLVLVEKRLALSHALGWGRLFGLRRLFGDGLLTMDGDEHAHHRQIMNPAFSSRWVAGHYLPIIRAVLDERVTSWAARGEIELHEEARKIAFDVAAEALLGLRRGAEVDCLRGLYARLFALNEREEKGRVRAVIAASSRNPRVVSKAIWLKARIDRLLLPRIRERRRNPGEEPEDVLGMLALARGRDGRPLPDKQLLAHAQILLVAGHETSASLAAWLLYLLSAHRDYEGRVLAEQREVLGSEGEDEGKAGAGREPAAGDLARMAVLDRALLEAERLYPPTPQGPRGALEDFEFAGYRVPAGSWVFYHIAACHHAPSIWRDPEAFDPDRFAPPREEHKRRPYSLVTFGGGARICLGINLAKMELKALASHVLRRHRLEILPGQNIVQFSRGTARPLEGIRARVSPR